MKFKNMILPVVCGTILAFSFILNTFAASSFPGSEADPVVTKSYVDKLILEVMASVKNSGNTSNSSNQGKIEISEYQMEFIIEEVTAQVLKSVAAQQPTTQTQQQSQSQTQTPAQTAEISTYKPVNLAAGQILIGEEGTEIILRSGTAKGYTMVSDGLANTTTGQDVGNNADIGRNNMLIVPRGDGRGVKAATEVWLLVKGAYYISR